MIFTYFFHYLSENKLLIHVKLKRFGHAFRFMPIFKKEKEMLDDHTSALAIPADTFKQFVPKSSRSLTTTSPGFQSLRKKPKARSIMQASSSDNFQARTFCRHACKSVTGLECHRRLKQNNWREPVEYASYYMPFKNNLFGVIKLPLIEICQSIVSYLFSEHRLVLWLKLWTAISE